MKPLAIDLYCGLGGWSEGLLAEGWRVVGFDVERHRYPLYASVVSDTEAVKVGGIDFNGYGTPGYKAQAFNGTTEKRLRATQGEQIGWQEYPAQLVLQDVLTIHGSQFKDADLIVASPPCQEYSHMAMPWSIAKQKAREYADGTRNIADLTALFDACFRIQREACEASGRYIPLVVENVRGAQKWVGRSRFHFGSFHLWGDVPALMPMARKHVKVPNFRFDGSGKSFQSESVKVATVGDGRRTAVGNGARFTSRDCGVEAHGIKQGGDWFNKASGNSISRRCSSRSNARKQAAATIAKIPLVLSRHIARAWYPDPA